MGFENKLLIKDRTFEFSLLIIDLYKFLVNKKEYVLSKQILRSGTSIGANVEEAQAAQSKKDFVAKMSIASKEARETFYWLTAIIHKINSLIITNIKNISILERLTPI